MGESEVSESTTYTHIGVPCDKYHQLDENVQICCTKLRQTYFGINEYGISHKALHSLTMKKLYNTIVLPRALYGSELWNELQEKHISSLERAHKACVKHMQNMPTNTRTDVALSCIAVYPIETFIDRRKLLFLGQLCHTDPGKRISILFLQRLVKFMNSPSTTFGFLPDVYIILEKYSLNML